MVCSVMGAVVCVPVIFYYSIGIGSLVSTNPNNPVPTIFLNDRSSEAKLSIKLYSICTQMAP